MTDTLAHYRIINKLGAGGMGEVYLAEDTRLNRKVAIKFLPPDLLADSQAKRRLTREAQAAAALDHPNMCGIHEVGEEEGRSFIVMQYVEGETLAARLKRQAMDLRQTLMIATQIADALADAHAHGVIHRDIKPQNIMLTTRGQVKVLDFGLAKIARERSLIESEAETDSLLSAPGLVVGTAPYMSPEQVRGEGLDGRSDIFSFGCVIYEMVSGRGPFAAENIAMTVSAILAKEPQPLTRYASEVPTELQRIVRKCLEKDRDQRYQSARDLLIDLRNLKREIEPATTVEKSYANPRYRFRPYTLAALTVAILAVAAVAIYLVTGHGHTKAVDSLSATSRSIAVLPFKPLVAANRDESLEMGMAETLITKLSGLEQLVIRPMNAVRRYGGSDQDPLTAGREQRADLVLEGSFQKSGDKIRVTARLWNVADGKMLWSDKHDQQYTDIFAVQDSIAEQVTNALTLRLAPEVKKRLIKHSTENGEAYYLYVKGIFHLRKQTAEDVKQAITYLEEAVTKDPLYALAYSRLSFAYAALAAPGISLLAPKETMLKSKHAALTALRLDDALAEAHISLAFIKIRYDWDWQSAEDELKRAIELDPTNPLAQASYGDYLSIVGRHDESIAQLKQALEFDPLDVRVKTEMGYRLYIARLYDQAIEQFRSAIEMDPNDSVGYGGMGWAYEQKGMYGEAITIYSDLIKRQGANPASLSMLGRAYAGAGRNEEARKVIRDLDERAKRGYVSPYLVALVYARLGDKDQTVTWLEKAYDNRDDWIVWIKVDPALDVVRPDPRFMDLLRRVGFPPS